MHAFGITEVFNIANHHEYQRRQQVMQDILDELNADNASGGDGDVR